MKYLKKFNEELEYWEIERDKANANRELKRKYPDLGKIVKFSGEYGVVIIDPKFDINSERDDYTPGSYTDALVVRWDTEDPHDMEQYGFFDYEYLDDYDFKYINKDGSLK